ncbi:MAG: citrate synthase, partial [Candidatus Aenigmarchaeota archaeon]|nr:citrate synthase [Candidatus Aenigmarchaeota archaeon]
MPEKKGLEDIIAGQSSITFLDGHKAKMLYRGYDIVGGIAEKSSFEEICYLLWYGELPNKAQLDDIRKKLASERDIPVELIDFMKSMPKATPMEALRTLVSILSHYDKEANDNSKDADIRKAIRLTSKIATISANIQRMWQGKDFMYPSKDMGYAEDFLYMINGKRPSKEDAKIFDACLILHADHEFNASTFTARVVAS